MGPLALATVSDREARVTCVLYVVDIRAGGAAGRKRREAQGARERTLAVPMLARCVLSAQNAGCARTLLCAWAPTVDSLSSVTAGRQGRGPALRRLGGGGAAARQPGVVMSYLPVRTFGHQQGGYQRVRTCVTLSDRLPP